MCLGLCLSIVPGCDQLDAFRDPPGAAAPGPDLPSLEVPSTDSQATAVYFTRVEEGHLTRGLLREDGGGPDTPFDARRLAETFRTLAFAREFTDVGAALVRREGSSILHKWAAPVRVQTMFGPAVSVDQQAQDRATVASYATRLGRITRHPVTPVQAGGNFTVLVLTEDERRVAGPLLRRLIPEIRKQEIDVIQGLTRSTYCVVVASDPDNDGRLRRAVAIIRAELPDRLRLSCFHEEIAQGLGLANDSPRARPSIFNDDDEFGRLTAMDEKMLRMLYDPQLTPGMTADAAMPIIRNLAEALTAPSF